MVTFIQELYKWILTKEKGNNVTLPPEQKSMLLMSEEDINNGRLISESDLNKADEQWLS
ncbi:hypothetical protein FACS1894195_2270 [Bacteroidia bacterium]|nr:hypothetical protein FACS1894195_2270 [Bacteroidia bacterium]